MANISISNILICLIVDPKTLLKVLNSSHLEKKAQSAIQKLQELCGKHLSEKEREEVKACPSHHSTHQIDLCSPTLSNISVTHL